MMNTVQLNNVKQKEPERIYVGALPPYMYLFKCGNCGEIIDMNDYDQGIIKQCDKCGCHIDWNY